MLATDPAHVGVVWFPQVQDVELERVHAAAAAGEYLHFTGADRPRDRHPPLMGADYVAIRWPTHAHLDEPDRRDPRRQLPYARRALARAREKAGLLADLQTWPTPEERVAAIRENAVRARSKARATRARELLGVRARLRELPPHVRRAVILAWNARSLPGDRLTAFIDRFLRGDITPVPELVLPADLLILGCTATRDPCPERMPARKRFRGETIRFATGGALLNRGLSIVILSAELGLIRTWEGQRGAHVLGPTGASMTAGHAAALAAEGDAAGAFLHAVLVGPGAEERPPYRTVMVGGGVLHQAVVKEWEKAGVFRGAPLIYLPTGDLEQRETLASRYGIPAMARPAQDAVLQLPLL